MRKNMEPTPCTQEQAMNLARYCVAEAHKALAMEEKKQNKKLYPTFGEWKKENPNRPIAKMNYPEDEYIEIIAAYPNYFNLKYAVQALDV